MNNGGVRRVVSVMTYGYPLTDDAQPICPSCGVTMHPLLDEGISADECRECGYRQQWQGDADDDGWDG